MDFEFSSEQTMLRDQAERFLREECPSARVRDVMDTGKPYCAELWQQIAEMGWHGIAIPEAYGGFGGGMLELCMLAEQIGHFLAPLPFASSQYLAARAILQTGSEAQKLEYLPGVASGERIGCLALAEGPGGLTDRLDVYFSGGFLYGCKTPVLDGMAADFAVVAARVSDALDAPVRLCLVELGDQGITRQPLSVLDPSRPFACVEFDRAPARLLEDMNDHSESLIKLLDGAATLFAFEQIGGADACLEQAREFALARKAFGRTIGSFQAIKHKLADMYIKNELARSNAYYAAWALASDDAELGLAAPAARISAIDAFEYASQENIQIHGGMGYTWEVDAHLYYRRSRMLAQVIGSAREWKERLTSRLVAGRFIPATLTSPR